MTGPDLGTAVKLLLFERVYGGHITNFVNLYRDDGRNIWFPVDRILDGWLTELDLLQSGELVGDRVHRVELTDRGLARYKELRGEWQG
ncbi:MAG: hypothetical protein ACRDSH_17835 [Pseudonocardiaceae bacterium]